MKHYRSKPDNDTLAHITRLFIHEGYHVSINQPYSNSITPDAPCPYKSLMIEVNKKTYLQNQSLFLDEAKATHLKATLHQLYQQLM
jgi:N-formylglutamate amidohydrolase